MDFTRIHPHYSFRFLYKSSLDCQIAWQVPVSLQVVVTLLKLTVLCCRCLSGQLQIRVIGLFSCRKEAEFDYSTEQSKLWETVICIYILTVYTKCHKRLHQKLSWEKKKKSSLYLSGGLFLSYPIFLNREHQTQHHTQACGLQVNNLYDIPPAGICSVSVTCSSFGLHSSSKDCSLGCTEFFSGNQCWLYLATS